MRRFRHFIGPQGMSGMVALWGASSLIKSVQEGVVSLSTNASATATIAAVATGNSLIFATGTSDDQASEVAQNTNCLIELTNATTVTATRDQSGGVTESASFVVVEFLPGVIKSVQRGTITIAGGATSNTAAITSVNTAKAFTTPLGSTTTAAADASNNARLATTNATTITATRVGTGNPATFGYQVVELF